MAVSYSTDIVTGLYASKVENDANYQTPGNFDLPALPVSGDTITSYRVDLAGSGYTAVPTLTVVGTGSSATVTARMKAVAVAIQGDGNSDYEVGDTITLTGGTSTTAIVLTVTSVDGDGDVTGVEITTAGVYSALPSNPVSQGSTSGVGTGATFNITWGVNSAVLGVAGSGYDPRTTTVTVSTSGSTSAASIVPVFEGSTFEKGLLCAIEINRAFIATLDSAEKLKSYKEIMFKMLSGVKGSDGSAAATKALSQAMYTLGNQNRDSDL